MDTTQNTITNPGQEGTEVATLMPLQAAIQPYVPEAIVFWWCVWVGMLVFIVAKNIILPFLKK